MLWLRYGYAAMRFDRIESMLVEINEKLDKLGTGGRKVMATVEELNAAVADLTTSVDKAVAAIGASHGIDPADLDAAVANIKAQAGRLNDAVHAAGM